MGAIPKKQSGGAMRIFEKGKTRIAFRWVAACALCCGLLPGLGGGCTQSPDGQPAGGTTPAQKPVLATVGDRSITTGDLKDYLENRDMTGAATTLQEVEQHLEEMILDEVLYQEAIRRKLDEDPEIRERVRQLLTRKLLDEQVNKPWWNKRIPEEEIASYYEAHKDAFQRPEQVRLADIFIAVPADAHSAGRADAKKKAEAVLVEAVAAKNERNGFGLLIDKYSDTPASHRKGDTGFFDRGGKPAGIDPRVAEAAFSLERNGDIFDGVVEAADGFHVVMRIGRRAAVHTPLEKVRGRLAERIRREGMAKRRDAYLARIRQSSAVSIREEALSEVARKMAAERDDGRAAPRSRQGGGPPRLQPQEKQEKKTLP